MWDRAHRRRQSVTPRLATRTLAVGIAILLAPDLGLADPQVSTPGAHWADRVLGIVGGLEVSAFYGGARITSGLRDTSGGYRDIAEGRAEQIGYRVALYTAPTRSGWSIYPVFGFLSQALSIADFREDMPAMTVMNAREILATCHDADTGEELNCLEPTDYVLHIHSGFAGARFNFDAVVTWKYWALFASASLGINVVELRHSYARLGTYRAKGLAWALAQSGAVGGTFGVRYVPAHLVLRFIAEWELYRNFKYDEPLELKTRRYNEDLLRFEPFDVRVPKSRFQAFNVQVALAYVF